MTAVIRACILKKLIKISEFLCSHLILWFLFRSYKSLSLFVCVTILILKMEEKRNIFGTFVVVQLLSHVWLFATSCTIACQASLSLTISWSLLKLMSIESVMLSYQHILCRPLLLLPSFFSSIRVFSNESALCIRWPTITFRKQVCSFLLPLPNLSSFHILLSFPHSQLPPLLTSPIWVPSEALSILSHPLLTIFRALICSHPALLDYKPLKRRDSFFFIFVSLVPGT